MRGTRHRSYNRQETDDAGVRRRTVGWEFVHVCVDDHPRLAYVERHPREDAETAAALERALDSFAEQGRSPPEAVMTDG